MSFEIGHVLETQQTFSLDIASVITGRTFMSSITRWGKSWASRKTVEDCFGHAGIIIIDPEGEYSSLREKYPFLIIGKDVPLQLETAEFMAEKTLESKISVIIDLSMIEVELSKEYVNRFLRRFFFLETTLRQPYLIVVEEAEEFGPEKGIATTTCLEILRNITKKGGKRGIGILVVAHRPAWVSKGIISQCTNKALGRIDWPGDLEVLEKYARIPHETIDKLPTLGKGEFCFTGDWVKETTFVKVGQVKTTHLGYTPEVIPPSPKELRGVIESLQKSLPEVIEKIKPTVVSTTEIEAKIRNELENKYKTRIESILKTANEKAERKYKVRIDELQDHIEKLSRSQALQPAAPITDVLEHPIVKSRMLELPDKARDLLVKIEREPGLTREQLAAFLTTSTNSVANLVQKVNQVFHATAIIGDGKPIRYKSMLKRLFITDVAKREIKEIERLQAIALEEQRKREEAENLLSKIKAHYKHLEEFYLKHKTDIENLPNLHTRIEDLSRQNQALTDVVKKQEGLLGPLLDLYREIAKEIVKDIVEQEISRVQISGAPIDDKKIEALVEQKIKELSPTVGVSMPDVPSELTVTAQQPTLLIKKQTPPLELTQESLDGRIAIVYAEGKLPEKAFTTGQLNKILEARFGTKEFPGNLPPVCVKFVAWGYFEKVRAGGRWDYRVRIPAEDASSKGLIREGE